MYQTVVRRTKAARSRQLVSKKHELVLVEVINRICDVYPPTAAMVNNFPRLLNVKEPAASWIRGFKARHKDDLYPRILKKRHHANSSVTYTDLYRCFMLENLPQKEKKHQEDSDAAESECEKDEDADLDEQNASQ